MKEMILIPQDDKVAEDLFNAGRGKIKDGKIEVKIPVEELSVFLKEFPVGVSFLDKETGEIYEVCNQEEFLKERIVFLMANFEETEEQIKSVLGERLRMLEMIKGTYGLSITDDGIKGVVAGRQVVFEWKSEKIWVPAHLGEEGFEHNGKRYRCYDPIKQTYQRFINNFDFQPLFMLVEEGLTGRTTNFKPSSFTVEERMIFAEKFFQANNVSPQLMKSIKERRESYKRDLVESFFELSRLTKPTLPLSQVQVKLRKIKKEWQWLEELYCPAKRIFLNKDSILIKGPRINGRLSNRADKWTLEIGPHFLLTLKIGSEVLDTISLMFKLGPSLAIEVSKLYGQRKVPSIIVLILDSFGLLS